MWDCTLLCIACSLRSTVVHTLYQCLYLLHLLLYLHVQLGGRSTEHTHAHIHVCSCMHVCVCVCVWRLTWTMQITPPCAYSNCLFVDMATCRLTVFTRCRSIINTWVYPAYTYMGGECRVVWLAIPYFLPPITRGRVIRQDSEPD